MPDLKHREVQIPSIDDLGPIIEIGRRLMNRSSSSDGTMESDEVPTIVDLSHLGEQPRIELHVGCGDACGVMAIVPYDQEADGPSRQTAECIAKSGAIILLLVLELVEAREFEGGIRQIVDADQMIAMCGYCERPFSRDSIRGHVLECADNPLVQRVLELEARLHPSSVTDLVDAECGEVYTVRADRAFDLVERLGLRVEKLGTNTLYVHGLTVAARDEEASGMIEEAKG